MNASEHVRIDSTANLAAAVPYLVGYQPAHQVVAIALDGTIIAVTVVYDLDTIARSGIGDLVRILTVKRLSRVLLIGYGPEPVVTPILHDAFDACRGSGIAVGEAMLIDNGRWSSYLDPDSTNGGPIDTAAPAAVAMIVNGNSPLASRSDVTAQVARVSGKDAEAMDAAVERAQHEVQRRRDRDGDDDLAAEAQACVQELTANRRPPDYANAAFLGVVLSMSDVAHPVLCAAMDTISDAPHQSVPVWTAITRLLPESCRWQAANLAAFAAWCCGDGALANDAITVSESSNAGPDNALGRIMSTVLAAGTPPKGASGGHSDGLDVPDQDSDNP